METISNKKEISSFVQKKLKHFCDKYSKTSKPIRTSFRSLCSKWNWAKRSDSFTHLMHRYPAKILPYIPIFFLSCDKWVTEEEEVLDPFSGTGTVLLESIVHPFFKRNSLGVEINPLARLVAKVKTTPIDLAELRHKSEKLISNIQNYNSPTRIPEIPNIDYWFSSSVKVELSKIRDCINGFEHEKDYQDFFLVCLSSIIRDVSLADPKIAPPILLKAENFSDPLKKKKVQKIIEEKKKAKPLKYFRRVVEKNWKRLKALSEIKEVASEKVKAEMIWDDARDLQRGRLDERGTIEKSDSKPIGTGTIGFVITSPPYINAQKYFRTTKFELLWLGLLDYTELRDLDRKIIGTERIYAEEYKDRQLLDLTSADRTIEEIFQKDQKRAAIVLRYFLDMKAVLSEISRVLKTDGRCILVVGNNNVRGVEVKNQEILSDIAQNYSELEVELILVDNIRSRGMITKRHQTAGMVLDEWIIVLKKK